MLERGIFWRKKHFRLVNVALRGGWTATYLACEASPESDTLTLSNAIWLSGIVQPTAFRRRLQIFFYNQTLDCIGALLCAEQSSSPKLQIAKWPEEEEKKAAFCAIFLFLGTTRTRTICTRTTRARKTQQKTSSSSQTLEGCLPTQRPLGTCHCGHNAAFNHPHTLAATKPCHTAHYTYVRSIVDYICILHSLDPLLVLFA